MRDEINQLDLLLDQAESTRDPRRKGELVAAASRGAIRGLDALIRSEWLHRVPLQVESNDTWSVVRGDEAAAQLFVAAECRLLEDMGVRPEAVAKIKGSLERALLDPVTSADAQELTNRIREVQKLLEDDLAELKRMLETQLDALEHRETVGQFRKRLLGSFEAIGGGLICGADGVLGIIGIPVTGGLSVAGAAFSSGIGGAVVGDGLNRAKG
jgi:hypothetical protein